jgi:oligopeptide transport system ATP-binding protein
MNVSVPLLEARGVTKEFSVRVGLLGRKATVRAVNDVSFTVAAGETYAIVGESGCGKSSLANALLMLDPPTRGDVLFGGDVINGWRRKAIASLRAQIQVVFQDPYASLNNRRTVGQLVGEPLRVHGGRISGREIETRVSAILERVGLSAFDAGRYPFEFSGGQRQRIGIARALISNPKIVVCDEPVSALDVSVQAQVLNLLKDLQAERNLSYIFISHNLSVVNHIADRIGVMYLGRIVEEGTVEQLFSRPAHPYTRALIRSIPTGEFTSGRRYKLEGDVPSPLHVPPGCAFAGRCEFAQDLCRQENPAPRTVGGAIVRCHFPLQSNL